MISYNLHFCRCERRSTILVLIFGNFQIIATSFFSFMEIACLTTGKRFFAVTVEHILRLESRHTTFFRYFKNVLLKFGTLG